MTAICLTSLLLNPFMYASSVLGSSQTFPSFYMDMHRFTIFIRVEKNLKPSFNNTVGIKLSVLSKVKDILGILSKNKGRPNRDGLANLNASSYNASPISGSSCATRDCSPLTFTFRRSAIRHIAGTTISVSIVAKVRP